MSTEIPSAIRDLAAQIGGEIKDDELHYGPPESPIYISVDEGNGNYWLTSRRQLYTIRKGKPRRVKRGTKGEDLDWYYATVSPDQVRTALDLALGTNDGTDIEFAYEHILRDHCVRKLSEVEPGLSIYEKDGRFGVEFPAGGRFIDILAVDTSGEFVVLEFKLSRGHDGVVGQILYYINWVRENLATAEQRVRGIIIASRTTESLRLAMIGQPNIRLVEYELKITRKAS
jgi:hypothetical protein